MPARVATVTLNPAIDQTISIPNFAAGQVNRVEWEQSDPGGKGVNVAAFLADFGSPVSVTGFLGAGNTEIFRSFFAAKGIEDHFVTCPAGPGPTSRSWISRTSGSPTSTCQDCLSRRKTSPT